MALREEMLEYIQKEYEIEPENPFPGNPDAVVLRHTDNRKWFALFMYVKRSSLGLDGDEYLDIVNVKTDPLMLDTLAGNPGFFRGYHMNKQNWLTILLDGTISSEQVMNLIDLSYLLTASRKNARKKARTGPKDWLIPANPKYYDVITAFAEEEVIDWKQSSDVHVGDLVYLYVGAPYSSILYKCEAVEVNIPYRFEDENLNIQKLMKIRRLAVYEPGVFSFSLLKEFGVYAVRGPRSMPEELKQEIEWRSKRGS